MSEAKLKSGIEENFIILIDNNRHSRELQGLEDKIDNYNKECKYNYDSQRKINIVLTIGYIILSALTILAICL